MFDFVVLAFCLMGVSGVIWLETKTHICSVRLDPMGAGCFNAGEWIAGERGESRHGCAARAIAWSGPPCGRRIAPRARPINGCQSVQNGQLATRVGHHQQESEARSGMAALEARSEMADNHATLGSTANQTPADQATVGSIVNILETAYPPYLAESWDAVGLICGDPAEAVKRVAFALDCTDAVADAAIASGAQMLVVHHPLLMRGVTSVAANTPKGRIVHKLIRAGVALFAAHTNADSARPGVNDKLAELLGVRPGEPLRPIDTELDKWGFTVPVADAETVKAALFDAGAGRLGDYSEASFEHPVTGQFRPNDHANPHLGARGELKRVDELRVEFVAPASKRAAIRSALISAHPYEEPAYDVVETHSGARSLGIGRVGELDQPMSLREFTHRVRDRLPATTWGVRAAGDPDAVIRRVAVASGAGDSFLNQVAKMDVDCFVTSDLRHHPVDEHLRAGGCAVIDTAHWASEFPWCEQAADIVGQGMSEAGTPVRTEVLSVRTDPWTIHGAAPGADN